MDKYDLKDRLDELFSSPSATEVTQAKATALGNGQTDRPTAIGDQPVEPAFETAERKEAEATLETTTEDLEKRNVSLETLYRAGEMISRATTLEGIVRGAAELLPWLEMTDCTVATITELDPEGAPIRGDLYTVSFENNEFAHLPNAIGKPIRGWLPSDPTYYSEFRVTVFPDLLEPSIAVPRDNLRSPDAIAFMLRRSLRGAVVMGLGAHGRKLGYLTFCSTRPLSRPPQEYIEQLQNIVDLVATAVDNLQLSQHTQDALAWQQALYRASEMIGKATTLDGIVRGAAELLPPLDMFACTINHIIEEDLQGAPIRANLHTVNFQNGVFTLLPTALDKPVDGWMPSDPTYYSEYRITVFPDLEEPSTFVPQDYLRPGDSVAFMRRRGVRGAVSLGLGAHGRKLGYLTFSSAGPLSRPPQEYIERLQNIVDLVATAVDNLQLLQQMQEEQRRTQTILETVSVPMIISRLSDSKVLYANQALAEIGNIDLNVLVGGKTVDYFADPADRDKIAQILQQKGRVSDFETQLRRGDGTLYWTLLSARIMQYQGDLCVLTTYVDITERKQAEAERARLYEETQSALEEVNALHRVMTREGWQAFRAGHEHMARGYLFDQEVVRPATPGDFAFHGEHVEVADQMHAVAASDRSVIVRPLSVRDEPVGVLGLYESDGQPLSPEEEALLESVSTQVAQALERARLLEQTQKRAVEIETVAQVSTVASTILDPDQLLVSVVNLTKQRFGLYHCHVYTFDEANNSLVLRAGADVVGEQMAAEGVRIPLGAERSLVARAARSRQPVIANNVSAMPDWLANPLLPDTRSEMAVPLIIGDQVLGVFDVQSDQINTFSDEEARIFSTLASQVAVALQNARLYAEQSATVIRLRELDHLKSTFLANMSHELRTPLNSILGFTDVMLEGLDGPLTDQMDNDLKLISRNGQHLLSLISDVLDMAKIEAGKMNLTVERFNLREVLEEVMDITGPLAREKSLALQLQCGSGDHLDLRADRIRLRQVMINLVGNAIKFTEQGSITLLAERSDGRIRIGVKDTGIGVTPDQANTIFEEFSQVDTSTTRKVGGTGLGLPISRRLVELHGGRLWVESTGVSGEGSTFMIELPIAEADAE